MTDTSPWPDDVGAYCSDIPDAISLRDLARERAREAQHRLTADEAFAELVAAFWRAEFGGAVFTLEKFAARSREELDAESWPPDTLARQAVFWTAPEYAAFLAQFWRLSGHPLPELGGDEARLRWLAALSLGQYPADVLTLFDRLHISRAIAERLTGHEDSPRKGREKPFWVHIRPKVLAWLDDEGEPDTLAEVERLILDQLSQNDWDAAESTVREHARAYLDEHRRRRKGR